MLHPIECQPSACIEAKPPAKILRFVSRAEHLRLRGLRNYAQWRPDDLDPLTPRKRIALIQRMRDEKREDREWALRHEPRPGGAIVLAMIEPLFWPLISKWARERTASTCGTPESAGRAKRHMTAKEAGQKQEERSHSAN